MKALIAEDESIIAMDIEMALTEMGYLVVGIASTGESVIRMNKELQPDIILMDIRLSGPVDGFQTAVQILKEYDVPILFVTAGSEFTVPQKLPKYSRFSFLRKPFSSEQLQESVRGLLKRKTAKLK